MESCFLLAGLTFLSLVTPLFPLSMVADAEFLMQGKPLRDGKKSSWAPASFRYHLAPLACLTLELLTLICP